MANSAIHYEVFVKKHRKAGWSLAEARQDREEAIAHAKALLKDLPQGSVRVSKERFDSNERVFRSSTIFEEGTERYEVDADKKGDGSLPCVSPDDLTNPSARDTMSRVLNEWFVRKQVTPMELMHSPAQAEDLESGGTEVQHAIQKVAVASARDGDSTVHAYVKQLNDLAQRAFDRIYKDGKTGKLPRFSKYKTFGSLIEDFKNERSTYKIAAAISDRLSEERGFGAKLNVLMEFADELPDSEDGRALGEGQLDVFISEILNFDSGLSALVGHAEELGDEVQRLADMFDGSHAADSLADCSPNARKLTELMKSGVLPSCKTVVAAAILERLQRPRRMRPGDVVAEVQLARKLAQKLVMAQGPELPADALQDAFSKRSARLLTPETIGDFLAGCSDPEEEIESLLDLEENIVGSQNKQKLAGYIRAALGGHKTEGWFVSGPGRPVDRLYRLAGYQNHVLKGTYPAADKKDLCEEFDQLGRKILERSNVIESIARSEQPVLDRAQALLKLITRRAIPQGYCSEQARLKAIELIRSGEGLIEAKADIERVKLSQIEDMLKLVSGAAQAA